MHICCHVDIKGIENVKNSQENVIFASNHVSQLDPLFIVASLPFISNKIPIAFVVSEKEVYAKNWHGWRKFIYGGEFFRMIGGYAAYSGRQNYEEALPYHIDALNKGTSVCIFPLGRRHGVDEIDQAKGGVAYLTKKTTTPIIPIKITSKNINPTIKDFLLRKNKLTITYGAPILSNEIFDKHSLKKNETYGKDFDTAAIKVMKRIVKL